MVNGQHGLTGGAVGNAIEEVKAAVRASGGYVAQAEYGAGVAEIVTTALRLR
jgi:hydroxymethylpyrimidine pyrophosphatase-like HAD family hydrolase